VPQGLGDRQGWNPVVVKNLHFFGQVGVCWVGFLIAIFRWKVRKEKHEI
jgi:hypothetical protein